MRVNKRRKFKLVSITALAVVLWGALRWGNSRTQPPQNIGTANGRLAPCPDTPNCISTDDNSGHDVLPLPLDQSRDAAMADIQAAVESMPGSRVVTVADGYVHAEFRSIVFGFVDDVEFLVDEPNGRIDVRSASRIGYSDLGTNRRRVEDIRRRLATP